ncbi:unnamed protein product [Cylicostephanus goldi]|uniref:Macroglobulin domain-containing protein n=1 Tax=Cylicostephanus goldi TaxID=71465 RepID=A0A3P6QXG6_CYLGO|nr:unnamed protein product [Cylicostephanus goldi]
MLITDGLWKQSVNLSICFSSSRQTATVVTVEIRDRGSGNRGEAATTFDPLYPGFEIVPLRPVYNARTKELLLKIDSVGAPVGSHVEVIFYCLGDVMQKSNSTETLVGNVLSFEKPEEWNKCNVIMVEATRSIGTTKTRKKTLMLPMIADQSALEPSWIEIESLRAAYYVGESLNVSVQGGVAPRSLNYVVRATLMCFIMFTTTQYWLIP